MNRTHSPDEARLVRNYRLVYELVRDAGEGIHLRAGEVFARARQANPRIGQTTVYRALARLRDLGYVSEVRVPGGEFAFYEVGVGPHAHFHCSSCGAIEDVDFQLPAADRAAAVAATRGEVDDVIVTLQGRCAACRGSQGVV